MSWDMAKTTSDTEVAESIWHRAERRLGKTIPQSTGDSTWTLSGDREFDDTYQQYLVSTDREGTWYCSCHDHYGGEFRRRNVCSHLAAVALYTGLPCHTTMPLKDRPRMKTPERPCDIAGTLEAYSSWRPYQRETVEQGLRWYEQGIDPIILDASTGAGKSLTAVSIGKLANLRTLYVVSTLQLQEQLANDFPGAVVIWGREHYQCPRFGKNTALTAADCTHRKSSPCPKYDECPYKQQKKAALTADLTVVNYSFFLVEANNVGQFSGWPLIVFDEGDTCESELMKYVSLTLTTNQLDKCHIGPPQYKTKLQAWLEWVHPTKEKVAGHLRQMEKDLQPYLEADKEPPLPLMNEILKYQRLQSKLGKFDSWADESWVLDMRDDKWNFKPTFIRKQGKLLWGHAERMIVMSATILNARDWAFNLGLL